MSESTVTTGEEQGAVDDVWAEALAEQAQAEVDEAPAKPAGKSVARDAQAQPAAVADLKSEPTGPVDEKQNLEVILDIPVSLSMEIGRTQIPIRNLLQLSQGSVVELDRLAGEPMDVLVNGTLIAHGEVVVVNEKFGIRLTDVISPAERVKTLK